MCYYLGATSYLNVYMLIEKKDKRAAWLFKFVSFAIVP